MLRCWTGVHEGLSHNRQAGVCDAVLVDVEDKLGVLDHIHPEPQRKTGRIERTESWDEEDRGRVAQLLRCKEHRSLSDKVPEAREIGTLYILLHYHRKVLHICLLTVNFFQTTASLFTNETQTSYQMPQMMPFYCSHTHTRTHRDSPVALPSVPYIRVWYGVFVCLLVQEVKHVLDGERQGTSSVCCAEDSLKQVIHKLLEGTLRRRTNTALVSLQTPGC